MDGADAPFTVKKGLFDQSKQDTDLGLSSAPGTETITVFAPSDETDHFSNGVVMIGFKGKLYCQWQSSKEDEDASETRVVYSISPNGKDWSAPKTLAETIEKGYRSSGGWWVNGDTLVAYLNVWPSSVSPRGGHTEYRTSTDGENWSAIGKVTMKDGKTLTGIFEQDPHALPDGRIINAAHFQKGLIINPIYTDDPSGIRGWIKASFTNLSVSGNLSRGIEPSWFRRKGGAVVMVFRDQKGTMKRLASVSLDRGESWSKSVVTDMVDSRSKQCAGNLPDGTAFQVGNPVNRKLRIPLAISLSKDGHVFDKAFILRKGGDDRQKQRYKGEHKGEGYSYPKAVVWKEHLYVSYATNKEDAQCSRVPLASLYLNGGTDVDVKPRINQEHWRFTITQGRNKMVTLQITGLNSNEGKPVAISTLNGKVIYRGMLVDGVLQFDITNRPAGLYLVTIASVQTKVFAVHN